MGIKLDEEKQKQLYAILEKAKEQNPINGSFYKKPTSDTAINEQNIRNGKIPKEQFLIQRIAKMKRHIEEMEDVNDELINTVELLMDRDNINEGQLMYAYQNIMTELDDLRGFYKWERVVEDFFEEHDDFDDFADDMAEILIKGRQMFGDYEGLENAYHKARSLRLSNNNKVNGNQAKKVSYNSDIKKKIIEEYLQSLGKSNAPMVISADVSGRMPLTAPIKPKTMKEAAKMAISMLDK